MPVSLKGADVKLLATVGVLDKGFVRLVDYMGDDQRVLQAARVSTGKDMQKADPEKDRKLLRFMFRKGHTSPFEKVRFEFHAKMPIFVARQWVRHRMASINEASGRYKEMPEEFYIPKVWRSQSKTNKQGADADFKHVDNVAFSGLITAQCHKAFECYQELMDAGVAKEMARLVLPLNLYTEWYWTTDLHNLLNNFLYKRLDEAAQWEMRQYADAIYELITPIVPWSVEAFEDYKLHAVTLSHPEVLGLQEINDGAGYTGPLGPEDDPSQDPLSVREHVEFVAKLKALGISYLEG